MTEVETPPGRSQRRLTARGIGSDGQKRKATREGLYKGVGESTYLKKSKVGVGGGWGGGMAGGRQEDEINIQSITCVKERNCRQSDMSQRCRNMEQKIWAHEAEYYQPSTF